MDQGLTAMMKQLRRRMVGHLSGLDQDTLSREERDLIARIRLAVGQLVLDIQAYEYADTRVEQRQWAKIAKHNLSIVEESMLHLPEVFSAIDTADLGANIERLMAGLD